VRTPSIVRSQGDEGLIHATIRWIRRMQRLGKCDPVLARKLGVGISCQHRIRIRRSVRARIEQLSEAATRFRASKVKSESYKHCERDVLNLIQL
jgi:hypothetical protein